MTAHQENDMTTNTDQMAFCPRFLRTDSSDGASEVPSLVRITDGKLAAHSFACEALDGRELPYLVQVTTGPETGDDFVGLFDLDGDRVDVIGQWEIVTEAPVEVIEQIENGWETGFNVVTRLGSEVRW